MWMPPAVCLRRLAELYDVGSECHLYECYGTACEVVASAEPFCDFAWPVSGHFGELAFCDAFPFHDFVYPACDIV